MKICEIEAHSFFENWLFSTKIGENRWTWGALLIWKLAIFDEHLWKLVKLRRTPYLKTGKFRRQLMKNGEIEAHSFFENWQVSTKIGENRWNWGALLISKLASFDENSWKSVKLRRTPYFKTGKFRRKLVTFNEIEAPSLFENFQWNRIRRQLLHKRFARATVAGPLWVKVPPRYSLCRSRRELSNEYVLAKFRFDTAEDEPCKVCPAAGDV